MAGPQSEKILFFIPAFNEEASIGNLIEEIKSFYPVTPILVIDDGSCDETNLRAEESGAFVIRLPLNMGIGVAVQTGFMYAVENSYDWAIRLDADGQHRPEDLHFFIEEMSLNRFDLIIGSRFIDFKGFQTSVIRRTGIKFFNGIIAFLSGFKITDATSGFTAFNRKAMKKLSIFFPDDYPEPESIVMLYKWGMKVGEIPVRMRPRTTGNSSITRLKSLYYMIKVTFAVILDRVKY